MAWRDSRASAGRLLLFSSSIVLGIAALVALNSTARSLRSAIQEQARALVGADLVIRSQSAIGPEAETFIKSLGGNQAREISFTSMLYAPATGKTRLAQVRALQGDYPFYGALETDPPSALEGFRKGEVLLEDTLLAALAVKPGDTVKLGKASFKVAGALKKIPGESIVVSALAPRLYISFRELPSTDLLKKESLARYKVFIQYPSSTNVEKVVKSVQPALAEHRLSTETVEDRKRDLGRSMENLYHFLNLLGFVALLLGGIGVASAAHLHVQQRLRSLALLKCLGASEIQVITVSLLQTIGLALLTSAAGALLGVAVQLSLPRVLADFLPFPLAFHISWIALAQGAGFGFAISVAFSLFPLLRVRGISPLMVLRGLAESGGPVRARVLLILFMGALITAFSLSQTHRWRQGLAYAAGLGAAFLLMAAVARLVHALARGLIQPWMKYTWRQGLANLYRPNNRTLVTLMSVGLGAFFILTIYLTQHSLIDQINSKEETSARPNLVMFDIQEDQLLGLTNLLAQLGYPISQEAPLVTMRLSSIKGEPVEKLWKRRTNGVPQWTLRREYRSTYRTNLTDGEELVAGAWPSPADPNGPTPVSVEDGIARDLKLKLGDDLVFDVQGLSLPVKVAALRTVDWKRLQPNFFFVFPPAALEGAPAFHIVTTRTPAGEASAVLQARIAKDFPNVSMIDLALVLQSLDSILQKVSFVIRFMGLFTVTAGLFVMAGALLTGRFQRLREVVLLRTLGASTRQITEIMLLEYALLGFLAALCGVLMAQGASAALCIGLFKSPFVPDWKATAACFLITTLLTTVLGSLLNRGLVRHPPLEVLRSGLFE